MDADECCDIAVVGGRCAGSAAAITAARAGKSVVVLERATFPADTISSHTMFRGTLDEIEKLGAMQALMDLDPPDLRRLFVEISDGAGPSYVFDECIPDELSYTATSVRRYLLDQAMARHARACGTDFREGVVMTDLLWRGGRIEGVEYLDADGRARRLRAALVLGADGRFSTVARQVGASRPYRYSHSPRAAVYRYLNDSSTPEPEASTVHHWRHGTSRGFGFPTTPKGSMMVMFIDDRAEVEAARVDTEAYWQAKLERFPSIARRFASASDWSPIRTTDQLSSFFRRSSGSGWALIGDAGHFKDPIIGQGMRDAFWAGRTVVEHVADHLDDPAELDRALRRWERDREKDCLTPYLAGVWESRLTVDCEALGVLAGALSELQIPIVNRLGSRDHRILELVRPSLIGRVSARAVRNAPDRRRFLKEMAGEVKAITRAVRSGRVASFRSSARVPGFESAAGGWPGPNPRSSQEVKRA